ncbi:hypothetical protein L210DRAFT_3651231 [Boletus edulis BED1]|uniref:Uncharacterized protein n=1 Tax=Boletus edulis BED1 TaxID=1328754 RepID=A0AAD4BHJ9_BOLED|nr:hypothetical protein L210DRAFT_3651231 [Boletus edulis BED1]
MAGRPPAKIITDHFKQLDKLENKSNRWYYACKYCGPDGPGTRIENRDNKPLKHLIDPIKCPLAPQSARNAARTYLASKASELLPDPIGGSMASVPETVSLEDDPDATNVVVQHPSKVLKRPSGTLLGYVDPALTAGQQERANVKLFR